MHLNLRCFAALTDFFENVYALRQADNLKRFRFTWISQSFKSTLNMGWT